MEFDILTQKMFESLVNTEGFQTFRNWNRKPG